MPTIFISYRRDDSADVTGRIYDRLADRFGSKNVFMDVDTIPPGVDFRKHLHDAVARCDVVLAVIGRDWLKRRGLFRKRRLDGPSDFVRIEIEAALQRDIRVVPVLVRDAAMPGPGDLPESIRDLAFRNAVQVRAGQDFRTDSSRLIQALEAVTLHPEASSPAPPQPETPPAEAPSSVPGRASLAASRPLVETPAISRPGEVVQTGGVITNSIGMKMVLIPAGEFMMGSPDDDPEAVDHEKPQHLVRITRPFHLGIYPVTQAEYERVMESNPSHFTGGPNRPVETVSWNDAQEFCRRLSALPEEEATGHVCRLPTEAEWEYACRAGTTTRYSFGDWPESLGDYAWWVTNSAQTTHPVGEKKPNAWGLYDMNGNVFEWCADWWGSDSYGQSSPDDPTGPSSGASRVLRGGSWINGFPDHFRCAYRREDPPVSRDDSYGFRVARTLTA